jgi:hypothetical protein
VQETDSPHPIRATGSLGRYLAPEKLRTTSDVVGKITGGKGVPSLL